MYPTGHARNTSADLPALLQHKASTMLGDLVFEEAAAKEAFLAKLAAVGDAADVSGLYTFEGAMREHPCIDGE